MSNDKAHSISETKQRPSHGEAAAAGCTQRRAEEHHQQGRSRGRVFSSKVHTAHMQLHLPHRCCDVPYVTHHDPTVRKPAITGQWRAQQTEVPRRRLLASFSPREGCHVSAVEMHIPHLTLRVVTCQATAKRRGGVCHCMSKRKVHIVFHISRWKSEGGERESLRLDWSVSSESTCLDGGLCGDRHAPCVRRRVFSSLPA